MSHRVAKPAVQIQLRLCRGRAGNAKTLMQTNALAAHTCVTYGSTMKVA